MSVEAMALVLHHSTARDTEKLILLGIANHAGDGGAWPTVATLARYANVSERAVQQAIGKLVSSGELAVHLQAGGMGNLRHWERPNRYDVLVTCPVTCDRTANHRHRPLPTAPAALWIDPVKPTSPGEAHDTPLVKPASPDPVKPTSPKPSIEPTTSKGSAHLTGPRASCSVCCLPAAECIRRAATSGHTYTPEKRTGADVLARVHAQYDDVEASA